MLVVGGPPGSGKSTIFPVRERGIDFFNADDIASALNQSCQKIPPAIRAEANRRLETFVSQHILRGQSFAFETTLRTHITFDQARAAHEKGFEVRLIYLALESVESNIERVAIRADKGGHAASPGRIREIHAASLNNFPRAVREFDEVMAYDNTGIGQQPLLVFRSEHGEVRYISPQPPRWLVETLQSTEYDLSRE